MATAGDVIQGALKRILVQAGDAPLEPDEYADAIDALNNLMAALEGDGVVLGYTTVTNIADEVTVPPGAIRGMIANLAIEVAPDYEKPVTPALDRQARDGLRVMRKIGQSKGQTSLPPTLPRGSGNTGGYSSRVSAFYGRSIGALMSLAGNARVTTISGVDTPVRVTGFWSIEHAQGLRCDINGRAESFRDSLASLTAKFTLSATGSGAYTFHIMKNGVSQGSVAATLSGTAASVTLSQSVSLYPGEYLEVWVEADSHTENCTVSDAQFEIS